MKTRELLRSLAAQYNWEHVTTNSYSDVFERAVYVDPNSKLGKVIAVGNWQPRERVFIEYNGAQSLYGASWAGPGDQSATTGQHVSTCLKTEGRNQKEQVIAWLQGK
jgi:hypothetical protein